MSIFIVGEIGINHNGDLEICKDLIKVIKKPGAMLLNYKKKNINKVYTKEFLDSYRESPWEF